MSNKRKKKYTLPTILGAILLGIVIFALETILGGNTLYGPYDVVKVVDGDTIRVQIEKEEVKVRMIGVNTPESVHNDEKKNTEEGKQASDFVKELLEGKQVYLEYDEEEKDQYGRTLAYVYLEDQKTMVEEILLSKGLGKVIVVQPNDKYKDHFYSLQDKAREEGAGFWGTGFFY